MSAKLIFSPADPREAVVGGGIREIAASFDPASSLDEGSSEDSGK